MSYKALFTKVHSNKVINPFSKCKSHCAQGSFLFRAGTSWFPDHFTEHELLQ